MIIEIACGVWLGFIMCAVTVWGVVVVIDYLNKHHRPMLRSLGLVR